MADGPKPPDRGGITLHPRTVIVGGVIAALGIAMLSMFLWMVPGAAAREAKAACRGLHGDEPLAPALCPGGQPCTMGETGVRAPDFTALDHEGKPVKLSDFRGKVVLLNFWASWCGVCRTEKPTIRGMAENLSSKDFVVVTLASDKSWSNVLIALVEALAPGVRVPEGDVQLPAALEVYQRALPKGIPFKVFLDPPAGDSTIGQITASWGIKAVPESALIDRNGNIRAYFVNKRDWESSVAETCLRSVIDE